jgi:hypothetical protein
MLRQLGRNVTRITVGSPILLATVIAATILLLASCGGGSSTGSATPTTTQAGSSTTAQASTSGSVTPTATFNTQGLPPDCAASTGDLGLVSTLHFDNDSGSYSTGEPVAMTLVLSNCGSNDAKLLYPTTQRYVFIVTDNGGNDMWRSTDGKSYAQTEGSETIPAAQTAQYSETWDQKDRNGSQVPVGTYKLSAFSVGCIDTARSGCEFGPIRFIQVGAAPAATAPAATTAPTAVG